MADNLPQYYENTLEPISLTKESLQHTADEFISYMRKAAKLIYENVKSPEKEDSSAYGTLFSGYLGTQSLLHNLEAHKLRWFRHCPRSDKRILPNRNNRRSTARRRSV